MQSDPRWTVQDLAGTARAAAVWWDLLSSGLEPPLPGELAASQRRIGELTAVVGSDGTVEDRAAATALVAELSAAGRAVHAAGAGPASRTGRVAGLHVSPGGVPKPPVPSAEIG